MTTVPDATTIRDKLESNPAFQSKWRVAVNEKVDILAKLIEEKIETAVGEDLKFFTLSPPEVSYGVSEWRISRGDMQVALNLIKFSQLTSVDVKAIFHLKEILWQKGYRIEDNDKVMKIGGF